jgi:MoaA/NifB/PqqE/SkfB family radical SAM enzyme
MDQCVDIDTLKQHLSKEFDLVCFRDLADLRSKHRSAFDLFKDCWRSSFQPHQRLVLYSSHLPEQSFIDHIQYAATQIDISNFFILFVCGHDLSALLKNANHKHGNDGTPMGSQQLALLPTQPFAPGLWINSDTLCPMPFSSATIHPDGSAKPCCDYQTQEHGSHIGPLQEIFYGSAFETVRQQMKFNKKPAQCARCFNSETLGSTSLRQLMLSKHRRELDELYLDVPTLTQVVLSPTSLCNFACRICEPKASSKIRNEEIKFAKDLVERQRILEMFPVINLDDQYIEDILNNSAIDLVHVLGGEPFLWPKLPSMIKKMIDMGRSKQLRLEFNSNGSMFATYLARQVDNFKHVEILLSIDAIGTRFEIERGGTWPDVLGNLNKYQILNRKTNVTVKLSPTINIQNLLYLDEVVSLAHDLGFDLVWWYLKHPSFLCIDNVTDAVKHAVIDLYSNHTVPELAQLPKRMSLTPPVSGEPFLSYMAKLDHRRNQVFSQSHQKICELMKIQL